MESQSTSPNQKPVEKEFDERVDRWRLRSDLSFHWIAAPGAPSERAFSSETSSSKTRSVSEESSQSQKSLADASGFGETATSKDNAHGYWVVRDPFSKERFCLNRSEKQLLELADGRRTLAELSHLAAQTLGDFEQDLAVFVRFFTQARRKGLLLRCGSEGPIDQLISTQNSNPSSSPWWHGLSKLIALRLPGIHPESIAFRSPVTAMQPIRQPQRQSANHVSTRLVTLFITLLVLALAVFVRNFESFANEASLAVTRRDVFWIGALMVSIGLAKTIHELAHVIACRWVGAECRELGIMLLFGTPCLYCDVTDVWSVPERWKRMLVSAAGMIAEMGLAAIATLIWASTRSSLIHDLSLVIMTVCTVSTIAINANPLLRYDGYYLLCDWIGTANLASVANQTLRQRVRRILWGAAEEIVPIRNVGRTLPPWLLISYAIASLCYRLVILLFISSLVYNAMHSWSLGILGMAFVLTLIGAAVVRGLKTVLQTSTHPRQAPANSAQETSRQVLWMKNPRVMGMLSLAVFMVACLLLVPLPCSESVPTMFITGDCHELHAAESGQIQWIASSGTNVRAGDVIIKIANDQIQMDLMQAKANVAYWKSAVQAWESRRGADSANATSLTIAKGRLESSRDLLGEAKQRWSSTTVRAPCDGIFIHHSHEANELFDPGLRVGKWISSGMRLGSVGDAGARESLAIADEQQIDAIRSGQSVRLRHASLETTRLRGQVDYAERIKWRTIPAELTSVVDQHSDSLATSQPRYLVRLRWQLPPADESNSADESNTIAPVPRSVATAEISVANRNLWERFFRLTTSHFTGL